MRFSQKIVDKLNTAKWVITPVTVLSVFLILDLPVSVRYYAFSIAALLVLGVNIPALWIEKTYIRHQELDIEVDQAIEFADVEKLKNAIARGGHLSSRPLHRLCYYYTRRGRHNKFNQMSQMLLASGINIEEKDEFGRTPLFRAAEENYIDLAKMLIAKGANIEAKSREGRTPLIEAAESNDVEMAKLLIAAGANLHATYFTMLGKNDTALDRAESIGNDEVAVYLEQCLLDTIATTDMPDIVTI